MSKLEDMINRLCPDGVEFRTMEEIFEIRNGYTPSKNNSDFWEGGTIPWFRMEDIRQNGRILSDSIQHITPAAIKGKGLFPANSIIIATTATIGEHALLIADSLANQRFTNLSVRKSLNKCLLPKFVFYYMFVIDEWCKSNVNAGNFASVDMKRFKKIEIPLPPLEVQEEIVRILDHFTQLEAELEAELDCRKRQYEYYRDQLLSFDKDNAVWLPITEVFEMRNGYTPSKNNAEYWEGGTIPWFRMEDIRQNGRILSDSIQHITMEGVKKGKLFKANSFIIATTATIGEHALIIADSLANQRFTNLMVRKSLSDKVVIKFLFHYMFIIDEWCKRNTNLSGFASVDMNKFKKLEIPIPPLSEQERIVAILDRFEALTTSLQKGLPAEIAARRQQYEYYRDRLLSFKKKPA